MKTVLRNRLLISCSHNMNKIPLNSNVGAFKIVFVFRNKTIGIKFLNAILQEN